MKTPVDERVVGSEEASTMGFRAGVFPRYVIIKGRAFSNPFQHVDGEGDLLFVDYTATNGDVFRVWND